MTLKEFSVKYDVPYHLVYGASYRVQPRATLIREKDYTEESIYTAVKDVLKNRVNYHRYLMEKDLGILKRMGEKV